MDQGQAKELLKKYQSGQCSPEEKALVEAWYSRRFAQSAPLEGQADMDQQKINSRQRILARIRSENVFEARLHPARLIYLAASVAAALLIGFFWLYNSDAFKADYARNETVSLITKPGQITSYVLPDSSMITLNGGSNVEYPENFEKDKREVTIKEGEAFFDVKHNPAKPFVVQAGGTKTQVLGTAFSIRAYQRLKNVTVTVSRGKVSVEKSGVASQSQKVFLLPDDQLLVSNQDFKYQQTRVNAEAAMSWMKGILDFNNEDLGTISLLLEKKFNVPVRVDDKELSQQRLTGKFKANETLDDILGTLGVAGNFRFRHDASEVLISLK